MTAPQVPFGTDVKNWVETTNLISQGLGDPSQVPDGDLVTSINQANTLVGSTGALTTTDQSDIVSALNEAVRDAWTMAIAIGTPLN
jgi:hypothetical protein